MESPLCEKPERHASRRLSDHLAFEGQKQKDHSLVDQVGQPRLTDPFSPDLAAIHESGMRENCTFRTQSREAVTQAQARIRGAVTRNKKEKLTALLHHVSIDVLRWAFFNLKKRAAPGADGLTWTDYAANLDRNLTDLHARVHSGAYRALP